MSVATNARYNPNTGPSSRFRGPLKRQAATLSPVIVKSHERGRKYLAWQNASNAEPPPGIDERHLPARGKRILVSAIYFADGTLATALSPVGPPDRPSLLEEEELRATAAGQVDLVGSALDPLLQQTGIEPLVPPWNGMTSFETTLIDLRRLWGQILLCLLVPVRAI
jgi:hypothetical protein